jgi:hypothetical protein
VVALAAVPLIRVELTKTPAELLAAAQGETLAPPGSAMVRAAATARCVQATSPLPLILLDALSRDLDHRCPQWVDVSGRTYSVDRGPSAVPRLKNRLWQRDILSYLLAGQQYVLVDTAREGLDPHTMRALGRGPVVARSHSFVLQRTVPGQAAASGQSRNARRRGRPD